MKRCLTIEAPMPGPTLAPRRMPVETAMLEQVCAQRPVHEAFRCWMGVAALEPR
jgi:hypothetical protein